MLATELSLMVQQNELRNALLGAVVTVVLSFAGFSPLIGGGVAGYLQQEPPDRGARVGALSGLIASIPISLVVVGGLLLVVGMPAAMGIPGGMDLLVILLIVVLLVAWNLGLSTIGGYLGGFIRGDSAPSRSDTVA
jgi:hypothetical protein